jgi:ATP-dependent metalloprotease
VASTSANQHLASASRSAQSWSILPNYSERRLRRLAEEADVRSYDAEAQAVFLRALGEVRPAEVISRVESGAHVAGPAVAREYIKALVKNGDLKHEKLATMLGVLNTLPHNSPGVRAAATSNAFGAITPPVAATGKFASTSGFAPWVASAGSGTSGGSSTSVSAPATGVQAAAASPLAGALSNGGTTNASPIHVALAEPSTQSQLWRVVRVLGTTFLLFGFLGVLVEERGGGGMARINTSAEPEPESSDPRLFSDVAGADEAKDELQELVEYLRSPATFTRLGGKLPKGVLLVGPPGTGKTLLARAVAGEAHRPFFYASGSSFEELYVGVGAKRVRELFAAAKRKAPCIVFIDEIDAIGGKRNPKDSSYMKLTLNELLVQLDGFSSNDNVIVIAATNSPESLDPALVRPGRFDRHVIVPNPDVSGRRQILAVHTKSIPLSVDVDLEIIARGTPGFSGADLANLANMAAIKAAVDKCETVSMIHLEFAKDKILMGAERKSAAISESTRRLTAYHEGGHGLMAIYSEGALPVHKATIVPRGQSLGMVSQLPDKDMSSLSRQQMMARLLVCMGGRAAEELIFGDEHITSGAESDFQQATNLAEAMVTRYGMSERLGHVVYERESQSPGTRSIIEQEIKILLDGSYEKAKSVLRAHEKELHNLAAALLDRETLRGDEVRLAAEGRLPALEKVIGNEPSAAVQGNVTGKAVLDVPSTAGSAAPQ